MSEHPVPQAGQPAPTFRAPASTGEVDLGSYQGAKNVVLYFYPKADTPGCTKEACAFRDSFADYAKRGVAVIGVSGDTVAEQQQFAEKYHLTFPLVADTEHQVLNAYGVWGERTRPDGTKTVGVRRWTFLIDKAGVIRKVYQDVSPEQHAAEILGDIEQLSLT